MRHWDVAWPVSRLSVRIGPTPSLRPFLSHLLSTLRVERSSTGPSLGLSTSRPWKHRPVLLPQHLACPHRWPTSYEITRCCCSIGGPVSLLSTLDVPHPLVDDSSTHPLVDQLHAIAHVWAHHRRERSRTPRDRIAHACRATWASARRLAQRQQRPRGARGSPPATRKRDMAQRTRWHGDVHAAAAVIRGRHASADAPTVAQQHADAIAALVNEGSGGVETEVVLHVQGDGCTLDDGTPVPDTVIERIAPQSFLRALIHDAACRPINGSGRQRHPTARQRRFVKARDQVCRDCGGRDLLEYGHVPDFATSRRTEVDELVLRCAPCRGHRHQT
jgi:hypothetical protein